MNIQDKRCLGTPIVARFVGHLLPAQIPAAAALLKHDCGVLAASTAFGKTVVAMSVLASRAVNTLILVHRRQLMDHPLFPRPQREKSRKNRTPNRTPRFPKEEGPATRLPQVLEVQRLDLVERTGVEPATPTLRRANLRNAHLGTQVLTYLLATG